MSQLQHSRFRSVEPAKLEERVDSRHRVLLEAASIERNGRPPKEALLSELSSFGCRLFVKGRLNEGAQLQICFDSREPIPASVVWSDGEMAGFRFDQPIDIDVFRSLTIES